MSPTALRDSVGNLPAELTSFVGRRKELADAKALLTSARLLTLTGMGGVGKTRLARRLGTELQRAFPHGVWQVELAELQEPALVAATIATALGLHESQSRWTIGALQEALQGRQLLLILDNCEHLLDACAVTADGLLRSCPSLQVVATSRQPLAIDGEQTLPVPPLPSPNPHHKDDLQRLEDFDATRLFVERARAASPGFTVDRHNAGAVAALCQRLDGLPLALEFAALRVRALSPVEILSRLDVLSSRGSRIAPARQQSLRQLVDWSYQLCSEPERRLWRLLSVVMGRFDVDTAESISGERGLVDVLVDLVDKSVLVRELLDGQERFRMPSTLREYGRERLAEAGEETAARLMHRDWFLRLTQQAHVTYAGPDQQAWFDRIRHLTGDARAALETSLSTPGGGSAAVDIVIGLLDHEVAYGILSEGRHWLERALRTDLPPLARARALRGSAYLAAFQGDPSATSLVEATALAREAGSAEELDWCAYTAGAVALFAGELEQSSALMEQALGGMRARGELHGLVNVLAVRVLLAGMTGDLADAQDRTAEFLAVADPLGERWVRAYVLWALGVATWRAGDLAAAWALELESMTLRLAFDDHVGLVWSAEVLAWIAADQGKANRAAALLGAASQAAEAIGTSLHSFVYLLENHDPCVRRLRAELGDAAFQAAWDHGRTLRPVEVHALATGSTAPPASAPTTKPAASPLTRREGEIAELVAQGLSNKEIAARLVIATRTAEGHVEHILVKLGFTSRAQVAAWVAGHR